MASLARRPRSTPNIWPGFVDALATLLMVVIFLLMIFVLAQFFLNEAIHGRDEALVRLESQVSELADLLSLEREANSDLRLNVAQLSGELQASVELRDDLRSAVETLTLRAEAAEGETTKLGQSLEEAFKTIMADKDAIELQVRQITSLRDQLTTLEALKEEMERDVSAMASRLAEQEKLHDADQATIDKQTERLALLVQDVAALTALREKLESQVSSLSSRLDESETTLVKEQELLRIARAELANKDATLAEERDLLQVARAQLEQARSTLGDEQEVSETARAQLALLNRQMGTLREQLLKLSAALEASETKAADQKVHISTLGARLNAALASKVQELSRYRSEFFGRLREVLGSREGVRIVGDRFVLQSEILFDTGSAEMGLEGVNQLGRLAETLAELSFRIPSEIDWVLRVDGHTDRIPIATARYPSNWELSTDRATSVVKFLIDQGIPPNRLAATGFAEFQPLDPGDDPVAYRRNRRIELKLTQR